MDSQTADELRKYINNIWLGLFKSADKNGDGNVNVDEFLGHLKEVRNVFIILRNEENGHEKKLYFNEIFNLLSKI